jgi:PAS domain S-box-containing protein
MTTDQALLKARLRERQLAAITADSADAIIMLDNEGVIQEWNHGAELVFGYAPTEVVGRHFSVLLPADLREAGEIERINRELDDNGYIRNHLTRRVTKDGSLIIVELTRTVLRDEAGNITGSSAIVRDVTERERAQAQVRELNRHLENEVAKRTQELSDANEQLRRRQHALEKANLDLKRIDDLKSEFVSLVSHELRAPLANISGSLQILLAGDEAAQLTPHQREIIDLANDETERLTRLVKGVLNVTRIEAGQLPLSPQAFDIVALIERDLEQWRACVPEHTWVGPGQFNLPSVWGDRDRVAEVLMNLLDNAYKYSRTNGTVRVDARVADNRVIVSVGDQGPGISPEELEPIFDKFHRVERGDARQTYGYGLGLYISRKFIEAMGGELWAESEIDTGSTFYFSLPIAGQQNVALTNT